MIAAGRRMVVATVGRAHATRVEQIRCMMAANEVESVRRQRDVCMRVSQCGTRLARDLTAANRMAVTVDRLSTPHRTRASTSTVHTVDAGPTSLRVELTRDAARRGVTVASRRLCTVHSMNRRYMRQLTPTPVSDDSRPPRSSGRELQLKLSRLGSDPSLWSRQFIDRAPGPARPRRWERHTCMHHLWKSGVA
jgi:hypothetical protein